MTRLTLELACDEMEDLSETCQPTNFDFLMLEVPLDDKQKSWIDHWPSGDLCCTQEMVDNGRYAGACIVLYCIAFAYLHSLFALPHLNSLWCLDATSPRSTA